MSYSPIHHNTSSLPLVLSSKSCELIMFGFNGHLAYTCFGLRYNFEFLSFIPSDIFSWPFCLLLRLQLSYATPATAFLLFLRLKLFLFLNLSMFFRTNVSYWSMLSDFWCYCSAYDASWLCNSKNALMSCS